MAGYFDAKQGRFRRHASPYVRRGVSDIIIVHRGRFYGVEIKTASGRQSEHQREFEQDLVSKGGGKYFIARSIEDGESIAKEILKGD